MTGPRIGVVIPSFNHAGFIEEAIESVLRQTRPADRILVVDDGSSDGSDAILRRIAGGGRIKTLFQENRGAHEALTRGIDRVDADLVFLLNSDDRFEPERIKRFTEAFGRHPALGFAGSWIQIIDARGRPVARKEGWKNLPPWELEPSERTFQGTGDPADNLLQTNYLSTTSNFVFTRALWSQCRPFRRLRYAHDWDFALRASACAEMTLVAEALVQYRVHPRNTIREDRQAMELEILWVLAANLPQRLAAVEPAFVRRLLHSLPTFPDLRTLAVLAAMAAADARDGGQRLERLLDPADPIRRALLGREA
jgi:glycosyltransferase involved in cell wall biosynthesis